MLKPTYIKTTLIFAMFVILSPFMMYITRHFLSVMLGFNIFLAYIPLFLMWFLRYLLDKSEGSIKYYHILLFIVFILFFPNTFYVITDAIHISSSMFYTYEQLYAPTVYLENIEAYVMLIHIVLTILFGIYAGVESLHQLKKILHKFHYHIYVQKSIVLIIIILSSIGIYIGRFMRFFSWDILNPIQIIVSLYERFNGFMIGFILLFTGVQILLYSVYQNIRCDKLIGAHNE